MPGKKPRGWVFSGGALMLQVFPVEVLNLQQLEILKLRNNPLRDLPNDIHRLKNLRTLVASFCMIESLPLA